jgi:hypothetical protein
MGMIFAADAAKKKRKQERVKRIKAPIMEKLAHESARMATDPKCANQATSPTAILSGGRIYDPSSPISST